MDRRRGIIYEKRGAFWVMRLLEAAEKGECEPPDRLTETGTSRVAARLSRLEPENAGRVTGQATELRVRAPRDVEAERLTVDDLLFGQDLAHIKARRWNRAQRSLQEVARYDQTGEAKEYLEEVRSIRRCLRQLDRSPRYARLHLVLGRSYLVLELGDEAVGALTKAVELEPELAEAYFLLGMEYLVRGDDNRAKDYCQRAHRLKSTLPPWQDLVRRVTMAEAEGRFAA